MNQMSQLLCQTLTFLSCVDKLGELKHSLESVYLGLNPTSTSPCYLG